jgi:hypothetical protein
MKSSFCANELCSSLKRLIVPPNATVISRAKGLNNSWACTKNKYRQLPIKDKKGKDTFLKSVRKCISRENVATKIVRMASRRARQYLIAYKALEANVSLEEIEKMSSTGGLSATPVKLKKIKAVFWTHWCAMDFDYKCVCVAAFVGAPGTRNGR